MSLVSYLVLDCNLISGESCSTMGESSGGNGYLGAGRSLLAGGDKLSLGLCACLSYERYPP